MATMRYLASMTPVATTAVASAATALAKARQQTMRREPVNVVVVVM
jgi:hypothetical protein